MDEILTSKADILAKWIAERFQSDSSAILISATRGDFDLIDHKISFKGDVKLLGFEFLMLYFHLADLYVFENLPQERNLFQNYVVKKVLSEAEIEITETFIDTYNDRLQLYSQFKNLIANTEAGETPKGTLLWEFGKVVSSIIDDTPSNIIVIMTAQSLGAKALADLWSLQLLHSKNT